MVVFRFLFIGFFLFLLVNFKIFAQGKTSKWIPVAKLEMGILLDSMSVNAESIQVLSEFNSSYLFEYNLTTGFLKVPEAAKENVDSLLVTYKIFPFSLHQPISRRNFYDSYDSSAIFKKRSNLFSTPINYKEEVFANSSIQKSGALTRGISFGNTQNLFVNSTLNLQLNGQLSENLYVRASITDQNIPFQPDGNTQNIQNFDNVLVELFNDKMNFAAGDVILQNNQSEFLKYYKNAQGALVSWVSNPKSNLKIHTQVSASLAKGKFASVPLDISEGVMGPYRIPGNQNEKYVIIIANSEKVYLDGRLLKRGFNFDYIIDYNLGEISFTPNVLITKYSRVNIDYEFAERNFSRSILTSSQTINYKKGEYSFNYYKEQDNKFRPLFFEFSDEDLRKLSEIGNNTTVANLPKVDSVAFDPQKILYKKRFILDEIGISTEFFEYSTDPNYAFFLPYFKEVGPKQGDYVRDLQLANGAVYQYIPRINGVPQGNYAISVSIPLPNKKQMLTAGARISLTAKEKVYAEMAFSDQDPNLFSNIDQQLNKGFAFKGGISSNGREIKGLKDYQFNALSEVEFNSANFKFIDRWRFVEFDRDWSLNADQHKQFSQEVLITSRVEMLKNQDNYLNYRLQIRNKSDLLQGIQQQASWKQNVKNKFILHHEFFNLNSNFKEQDSKWIRYSAELRVNNKVLNPGYKFSLDKNTILQKNSEEVLGTAMNFVAHDFFVRSSENSKLGFYLESNLRFDNSPLEGKMISDTEAITTKAGIHKKYGNHQLKADFTYRELVFLRLNNSKETTLLGKLDYQGSFLNNVFQHELSYALGNGREFKREFYFLPVPTGEGTHTWRDDNSDGLQQIQEFYLAINPEEKNFIKILVPTTAFVQAYQTLFNYRLNIRFPDSGETLNILTRTLKKLSFTGNINLDRKIDDSDLMNRINPFYMPENLMSLISWREIVRSTLFYNRNATKFGLDINYLGNSYKQLLALGNDMQEQSEWKLNYRFMLNSKFNLKTTLSTTKKSVSSNFFEQRNFQINGNAFGPEVIWQTSTSFRTIWGYQKSIRQNLSQVEKIEKATINQFSFDVRYSKAIKTTLNAQFKFTQIDFNGIFNSPVGYEMLQALQVGSNFLWSLNYTQKIGEGLQFQMVYDGRTSSGLLQSVHVGRVQVVALF